jgi:hypothetical protein
MRKRERERKEEKQKMMTILIEIAKNDTKSIIIILNYQINRILYNEGKKIT